MSLAPRAKRVASRMFGWVVVGAVFSCAGEPFFEVSARCAGHADCPSGMMCTDGVCDDQVPSSGPSMVFVEITPPVGSGLAPNRQTVTLSDLSEDHRLELPSPTELVVNVRREGEDEVTANVTLIRTDGPGARGRPMVTSALVSPDDSEGRLLVVAGTYQARVRPVDPSDPGLFVDRFTLLGSGQVRKEFRLPSTYRRLYGVVSQAQALTEVIEGARVRAVANGLESTVGVSGPDGSYEIFLPETGDTQFELSATVPDPPAWGFADDISVPLDGDRRRDISIEASSASNRGLLKLSVVGDPPLTDPVAIPGALVTLTAISSGSESGRTYRIAGLTNEEGQVTIEEDTTRIIEIPVMAARYEVDIVPREDSTFARTQTVLDLSAIGGYVADEQIVIDRPRWRTTIVARSRIEGTTTYAPVVARGTITSTADASNVHSILTDETGTASVQLAPGTYDVVLRPVDPYAGDRLLAVGVYKLRVSEAAIEGTKTFDLPVGRDTRGVVVLGGSNQPVVGAEVEFFLLMEEEGEGEEPKSISVSLGRTTTDTNGQFAVVLPADN